MTEITKKIVCPACAHEFLPGSGADLTQLVCPFCDAEIPEDLLRDEAELAQELAPGFRPGQRLGNYAIEAVIGSGGMAVVFRGKQLTLNRAVAIKILPKRYAKRKMFVERFESEAAALASLNHPNIVSVIDRGREGDTFFIVMEYVPGENLRDLLGHGGRLAPEPIFKIAEQVLGGLSYAHRCGVIHRDIKPGNILMGAEGIVKITDFGLAHLAKSRGGQDPTKANQALGTLKYMAPEQLSSAKHVDGRADLYSLGVCLYEMLTGKLPLGAFKTPSEIDPTLDARWDDIILRSLMTEPEERYQSADEMLAAMKDLATSPRVTAEERDLAEEAAVEREAASLTGCAKCGYANPRGARLCEKCGTRQDDLFERCPSCRGENRVDVSVCPTCRTDLEAVREKQRRAAEAIQAQARQLASQHRYDDAEKELNKLLAYHTREYAGIRESAKLWIARCHRRKALMLRQAYEGGQRMIAEQQYERALQLWEPLLDNYADIASKRRHIIDWRDRSREALTKGNLKYQAGDLVGAVKAWEKASKFWPQDNRLRKRMEQARTRLGNLHLRNQYLEEGQKALQAAQYAEARDFCQKVLAIDPEDPGGLALMAAVDKGQRALLKSSVDVPEEQVIPQERLSVSKRQLITVLCVVAGAGLLTLVTVITVMAISSGRATTASSLYEQAQALEARGEYAQALDLLRRVRQKYGGTAIAPKAQELAQTLDGKMQKARELCGDADTAAERGDPASLEQAYGMFKGIIAQAPVSEVAVYKDYGEKRLVQLRDKIGESLTAQAAALQATGHWREAFQCYTTASVEYGCKADSVVAGLETARKRLADFDSAIKTSQAAVAAGQWDEARRSCCAALDLAPADPVGNDLLARIAPNLKPPEGMVFVPPGSYKVGGTPENPERLVVVAHGYFIDRLEVTQGRFAEYVQVRGGGEPRGWSAEGRPPKGEETLPMAGVTQEEAAAFAAWASRALPTEEEWECAARGMSGNQYPWGDSWGLNAVLGLGPLPPGSTSRDSSPVGCMDMAGNVAEWTGTRITTPGMTSPPDSPALWAVKGSSWAGLEKGRPSVIVPQAIEDLQARDLPVLTPQTGPQGILAKWPSTIALYYVGPSAMSQAANVQIWNWLPDYARWVSNKPFPVKPGAAITGKSPIIQVEPPREDAGASRQQGVTFPLVTGCVAGEQKAKEWLEVLDPCGATRRIPYTVPSDVLARESDTRPNARLADLPDTKVQIAQAAKVSGRMIGQGNLRYMNVGFRCVQRIWTPPGQTSAAH